MKKLSGALISYNEQAKIAAALKSLQGVCDEIVVVDSLSTDATPEICEAYGCRLILQSWRGYAQQKQIATEQTSNDWVFSLDADEEVSQELRDELLDWKRDAEPSVDGFFIPRMAQFMGRWIKHTTWYPDFQLRLFRKSCGRWQGGRVHESFKLMNEPGRMKGHILHYSYSSISEYLVQLERFTSLAAADNFDQGRRAGIFHLTLYPGLVFAKNLLLKRGFCDGIPGLIVSVLAATSTFFKYVRLRELQSEAINKQLDQDL